MYNVLTCQHRLSLLALGTKHYTGTDGVELNWSAALAYYFFLAELTPKDKDSPLSHNYQEVEPVRLTDEAAVKEVTHLDGELFHWISLQAQNGVPWAKKKLGELLLWGKQGIERNVHSGLDFVKRAADEDNDKGAAHDYGMFLIKQETDEVKVQEGYRYLQKAAEKNQQDPRTLTTLGWYAEKHERNLTKAISLYKQAAALGSIESMYNLGWFLYSGLPEENLPQDKRLAYQYFVTAASHGLIHAGIMVAYYHKMNVPEVGTRSIQVGTEWARNTAEMNPKIGVVLHKAIVMFRKHKINQSAFWYMLAAYTGLEVASFNLGHLCETHGHGFLPQDCSFRFYNMSIQRDINQIYSKALVKMGDYYSNINLTPNNLNKAIQLYTLAAIKKDPEAFFNLGYMTEIKQIQTSTLKIPELQTEEKTTTYDTSVKVAIQLYTLCEEYSVDRTPLPCSLARYKLEIFSSMSQYKNIAQLTIVTGAITIVMLYLYSVSN